ncbi:MAG: DMT family transporter [Betaproteobacteria bacterium]
MAMTDAPRPSGRLALVGVLLLLGIGWGSTQSLGKLAVSSGHQHFGLIFWQLVIGAVVLGTLNLLRRKSFAITRAGLRFAVVIALIGTLIPNSTFYLSVAHLPGGVMSILISTVPLLSLPLALALGMDRFSPLRLLGLCCGVLGVALIALPQTSLPSPDMVAWLPVALIGPLFYAMEGNYVAKWGTAGLDAVQAMFWASSVGALMALPLTLWSGQWISPLPPYGVPELALIASSCVHALVYAGYVWLAARAGAVFATQVAYVVTGSGVLWAMLLLGERFSGWVWAALVVMLLGLFLVQPRLKA